MTERQRHINEALETLLGEYLSAEAQNEISAHYGEEVAREVAILYDAAIGCDVDWRVATIDTALPVMHELLDARYPWLSPGARCALARSFVMAWK